MITVSDSGSITEFPGVYKIEVRGWDVHPGK